MSKNEFKGFSPDEHSSADSRAYANSTDEEVESHTTSSSDESLVTTVEAAHPSVTQQLQEDVKLLQERVAANERRAGYWQEVATTADRVDDLSRELEEIVETIAGLEEQITSIKSELDTINKQVEHSQRRQRAVESVFSDRVIDRETAHIEAQQQDSSSTVTVGSEHTVWIDEIEEEPPAPTAVARIDGLVTFVESESSTPNLEVDQAVDVVITDVQETAAHAKPVAEVNNDE